MSIISIEFALFVLAAMLIYYIMPRKARWIVLLVGSYFFYWMNSHWLVLVLFFTSLVTYLFGLIIQRQIDKNQEYILNHESITRDEKKNLKDKLKKKNRIILSIGILLVLGALLFLKYFNFFGENVNVLFSSVGIKWTIPHMNLLLPLGISFYTLQAISYMVDVYRGKVTADHNPAKFLLFMSFFPQIIQGPIPRYSQLAKQLYEGHKFNYNQICFGAQMMLWGLIKKLVIAERLAIPVNYLFEHHTEYSGPILFFAVVLYGFQIYTDFSGGMDLVCGVAQLFGIELEKNFKQPYYATSLEDFWRRWHITMGSWMKEYIFYPLSLSKAFTSLSRKSRKVLGQFAGKRVPVFLAMFIAYFCVGFWHGPNWKYIAYGIWNGTIIMTSILLENIYAKGRMLCRIDENTFTWRSFRRFRTFLIVSFGRFFSRAEDLPTALSMFGRTFKNWRNVSFVTNGSLLNMGLNNANWILLIFLIILLFYVDYKHEQGVSFRVVIARQHLVFRWAIYIIAVLIILVFGYYGSEYNAASFVYEKF